MKKVNCLVRGLVACVIALAMVSTVAAQAVMDGAAKVVRIKGTARYMVGGGAWQPLKAGIVLKAGTVIQTAKDKGSCVDLVLSDPNAPLPSVVAYKPYIPTSQLALETPSAEQNVVRLLDDTVLGLDKLTYQQTGAGLVTETKLDLKAGRIFGSVPKLSAASRYEIKFPNGVAAIRGTKYLIGANGTVAVLQGSVVVTWKDPATGNLLTRVISQNEAFDPVSGAVGPASPAQISEMQALASTIQVTGPQTSTFPVDETICRVSPIHGHHGHGGGNGHGGDNGNGNGNGNGGGNGGDNGGGEGGHDNDQ